MNATSASIFALAACLFAAPWVRGDERATPEGRPQLSVTLKIDKAQYVRLEPIRLRATVRNKGGALSISHFLTEDAAAVRYEQVLPGGGVQELARRPQRTMLFCGVGEDTTKSYTWALAAGGRLDDACWLDNAGPAGGMAVRATFEVLKGPHKGAVYRSDAVRLDVVEPAGADKVAFDWMKGGNVVRTGAGNFAVGPGSCGLVMNSGSHHGRPVHEFFLGRFGNSVYGDYVRMTVSSYVDPRGEEEPYYAGLLAAVVDGGRPDFPLRPEAYAALLEHYKDRAELKKMAELSGRVKAAGLARGDSPTDARLAALAAEVPEWPPADPQGAARALDAERTKRARAVMENHWLVRDLTAAYGATRQPDWTPGFATAWFDAPGQPWPLTVKYESDEQGGLKAVTLQGSLGAFAVGRLKGPLARVLGEKNIPEAEALQTFVEATLEGDELAGKLQRPEGQGAGGNFRTRVGPGENRPSE